MSFRLYHFSGNILYSYFESHPCKNNIFANDKNDIKKRDIDKQIQIIDEENESERKVNQTEQHKKVFPYQKALIPAFSTRFITTN